MEVQLLLIVLLPVCKVWKYQVGVHNREEPNTSCVVFSHLLRIFTCLSRVFAVFSVSDLICSRAVIPQDVIFFPLMTLLQRARHPFHLQYRLKPPKEVFQLFRNLNNIPTVLSVHRSMSSTSQPHGAGGGQCPVQQAVLPRLHLGQGPTQRGRGTEGHGHPACWKRHPHPHHPARPLWTRRLRQVRHTLRQKLFRWSWLRFNRVSTRGSRSYDWVPFCIMSLKTHWQYYGKCKKANKQKHPTSESIS